MSSPEAPPQQNRSSTLWWGMSAIFVAGLIIALLIILIFGRGGGASATPPPTEAPAPTTSTDPTASPGSPDECQLTPGEQVPPTTTPEVRWEVTDYQVLAPYSEASGPAHVSDAGVPGCFSQDPLGALLAASHLLVALSSPDEATRLAAIEERLLEGPGKDEALAMAPDDPADAGVDVPVVQLVGFRFLQYTQDEVYITMARSISGQDGIVKSTMHLRWEDGDWYFDGTDPSVAEAGTTSELQSEFTPWGSA